jgi:tRNA (cmo5U34)-methyltransferase
MRHSINVPDVDIISVDNSPAMVSKCLDYVERDHGAPPVKVICDDLVNVTPESASFVVMNFTLQFIAEQQRLPLLRKIYAGMNPGGALLLSEKICFDDDQQQAWMTELHHEFKKANGYSELEISQKRSALENVLRPESVPEHHQRLLDAGFSRVVTWFQCFNFVSLLAVK